MDTPIPLIYFPDPDALVDYLTEVVDEETTRQGLSNFEKQMLSSVLEPSCVARLVLVSHLEKHGRTTAVAKSLISVLPDDWLNEMVSKILINTNSKISPANFILAISNEIISYWNQVAGEQPPA